MIEKSVLPSPLPGLAALLFPALLLCGCSNESTGTSKENASGMIYQMGQKVPLGPLTYNVLETNWKSQLGGGPAARIPKQRFLLVKLTITNGAGQTVPIPEMSLVNAAGQSFPEITEGVESLPKWLACLMN